MYLFPDFRVSHFLPHLFREIFANIKLSIKFQIKFEYEKNLVSSFAKQENPEIIFFRIALVIRISWIKKPLIIITFEKKIKVMKNVIKIILIKTYLSKNKFNYKCVDLVVILGMYRGENSTYLHILPYQGYQMANLLAIFTKIGQFQKVFVARNIFLANLKKY